MALRRRVHYKQRSTRAKLLDVQKHFPVTKRGRRSAVGIVARLWACRSGVRIPVGENDLSLLQNVNTGSEANPASYSVGTGILYRGCGQGVKLHEFLRPVYAFTAWTQETLPFMFLIKALRSILLNVSFIIINWMYIGCLSAILFRMYGWFSSFDYSFSWHSSKGFAQFCLPFLPKTTNINVLFAEKYNNKAGSMTTLKLLIKLDTWSSETSVPAYHAVASQRSSHSYKNLEFQIP